MGELARFTYLAVQGIRCRYRLLGREGDNSVVRYEIGSYELLPPHTLEQWSLEDKARHDEFLRLYGELQLYLSGVPMTLSGVDW